MLMLTRVKPAYADVSCPVCRESFLITRVGPRGEERPREQQRLEAVLKGHHGTAVHGAVHAPAFTVAAGAVVRPARVQRPQPAIGVPAYS